jgi:15-cis-phytoene synthase
MVVNPQTWYHILDLAHQGYDSSDPLARAPLANAALLSLAYSYCTALTAKNSRSFFIASSLLPRGKREAVRALYAFCRISDDLVDCPTDDGPRKLAEWRTRALEGDPLHHDLVAAAWVDARSRYQIPRPYVAQLLDGVERDFSQVRYQTFDELALYCYSVASTVGLMSMHIIGYSGAEAIPDAVKLGVALQLTNILRDVGEDWLNGRVYLPQDELRAFGLSESDLAAGQVTDRWRDFMRFQIARARQLYRESLPGVELLHRSGQHAIAAAATIYAAILDDIEANDYDVFSRRAYVDTARKLGHLARTWWSIHSRALPNLLKQRRRQPAQYSARVQQIITEKETMV